MENRIVLSYVMCVYKGVYLEEAIKSILTQDAFEFELLIYNDCSPDNIDEIVECFQSDNRLIYIKGTKNLGKKSLSLVWNEAVKYANGIFVTFPGDDDIITSNHFMTTKNYIQSSYQHDVFRCSVEVINSISESKEERLCLGKFTNILDIINEIICAKKTVLPSLVIRKKHLIKVGGFPEYPLGWFADDYILVKLALSKGKVINILEPIVKWRLSEINISSWTRRGAREKVQAGRMFTEDLSNIQSDNSYQFNLKTGYFKVDQQKYDFINLPMPILLKELYRIKSEINLATLLHIVRLKIRSWI